MNVADSELVAGLLETNGYTRADDVNSADAIFLNTCAIREHAEDKIHSRLGVLKKIKDENPALLLGLLGCMAQHVKNDILENKPYVDFVLGSDSYRRLPDLLNRHEEQKKSIVDTYLSKTEVYENLYPARNEGVNAWVSIMRGCDKFCTFCIVPFTRGRERSRTVKSICEEVKLAVDDGFKEITLLGQNVNSYCHGDDRFPELLEQVAKIPGVFRIRFTSPHPQDVNDDMLFVMRDNKNICKSIHLPLQAGADRILKRMNRTYTKTQFLNLVDRIRQILPGVSLSTDIIVGFPGETEEEYHQTLNVMDQVKFDPAFTFKYSLRPGTKAAEYSDQIPEDVKKDRLDRLIQLQLKHTLMRNKSEVGSIHDVLIEKESKKSTDFWAGRTDTNKWVIFPKGEESVKDFVQVKIASAKGLSLFGEKILKKDKIYAAA